MAGPSHLTLTPEIDEFRKQFEQIAADADALVSPLSDEQFSWHPAPDAWSIALCLEHLNATARAYLPALDEGIAGAIRRGLYAQGPFAYHWLARVSVKMIEPPVRIRLKTSRDLQPHDGRRRQDIVSAFRAYQVQYVDRLHQANGLNLTRAHVRLPRLSWIPLPLGSGFALVVAHERRHLWQARRVMSTPGFPKQS